MVIHQYYLGGGFGNRLECDYIVVAALAAKAVGKPVKIIYTREQDTLFDICRSPSLQVMRGALDKDGRPTAVTHDVVAGWPTARIMPDFLADTADKETKVDSFAVSGADFWYSVPNHQVRAILHDLAQQVVPPGYLRTVGPGFTCFAAESFIDEMAELAGVERVFLSDEAISNSPSFSISLTRWKGANCVAQVTVDVPRPKWGEQT